MTEYSSIASMARSKAVSAIHRNEPESAREWIEVAAAADRAADPHAEPERPEWEVDRTDPNYLRARREPE